MNKKWYLDENGVRVKPCSDCGRVLPYDKEHYTTRGTGLWSSYCRDCGNKRSKKYNKTDATRNKHKAFVCDGQEYETCTKCEKTYLHTFEYFDNSPLGQNHLRSDCRKCRLEYNRDYAARRWAWHLFNNARHSTAQRSLSEMNIDEQFILDLYSKQGGRCYWLGIPMVPSRSKKDLLQPSLDRLDRTKGYTKDNVVLCCFMANFGRNENSVDRWENFLVSMRDGLDYSQWQMAR